jgi:CrtC N-terminal lipocalin domain
MTSQGKETNGQPMSNTTNALAISGATDADYARFGIARDTIALWEDGARTDGSSGTYEWWYFDAHLDDGTKLVVVFMDKELTAPQKPLDPVIRINLDLPDGRSFEKIQTFAPETYSAETDRADIRIADNRFVGDLHRYCITAAIDDISVDVTLTGQVPAWRPETGCMLFGADQSLEFCWLPSVPQGVVEATFSIGDETHEASGVGYHDHNWGNVGLPDIIHARARKTRTAANSASRPTGVSDSATRLCETAIVLIRDLPVWTVQRNRRYAFEPFDVRHPAAPGRILNPAITAGSRNYEPEEILNP